jgi:hypothetical protein
MMGLYRVLSGERALKTIETPLIAASKTRRLGRKDGDLIVFFDNDGRPLLARIPYPHRVAFMV